MQYTFGQLQQISNSVGERQGWDFSRMRVVRDPIPWNYLDVVLQFLNNSDKVLDVGTGGGELFLSLAPGFSHGLGIDKNPLMIKTAQQNKSDKAVPNVNFAVMDGNDLKLENGSFDVLLNRHSNINVLETVRVLRSGGYFITQQVACRNTANILKAFGWTSQSFGENWWQPAEEFALAFEQEGCQIVAQAEYDVRYWFCDVNSLVFWLKSVPLPEAFDVKQHWPVVNDILQRYYTSQGIETNEHRELLIVRKL